MKKTLAILAACLTLGVGTPSASATAQDTTAVTTAMKADSTVTTQREPTELELAQAEIAELRNKVKQLSQKNDIGDNLVDLTAVILIFTFPFIVVFCWFYFRSKNRRAKYALIDRMVTSGQAGSVELLQKLLQEDEKKQKDLRMHGIRMICMGIGMTIFLAILAGEELAAIGILVACIGLGELLAGELQRREQRQLHQEQQPRETPQDTSAKDSSTDEQ